MSESGLLPMRPPIDPTNTVTPSTTTNGNKPDVMVLMPRTRKMGVLLRILLG